MKRWIALGMALVVSGCATSGYKEFYHDQTNGKSLAELPVIPHMGEPRLVQGTDPKTEARSMLENGYVMLGYSRFNGPMENLSNAISLAKALHAEVVITFSQYTNTVNGTMAIETPTSQTSYTTASATAYGSNGTWANAYGNGTTTTYGTQTNYVPYSIERYDQGAQFWIKAKPPIFGARFDDVSEEKRRDLASNKGAELLVVIKGSPAYNSDFLSGDIIRRIDGRDVGYATELQQMLTSMAGKTVVIEGVRNGKAFSKKVELNREYVSSAPSAETHPRQPASP